MRSLTDLQMDILTVIASTPKLLVVNKIATLLGKGQTTIFNSVETLIERGMLEPEREKDGIRKYLKLTEIGVCYAILACRVNYESILQNHPYLKSFREVEEIQRLVNSPRLRQEAYAELAFDRMFDEELVENYRGDTLRYVDKNSLLYMERVLRAISASSNVYVDCGVNIEEILKYIQKIKDAHIENLYRLSKRIESYPEFEKVWIERCRSSMVPVDLNGSDQRPSLKEFYKRNKPGSFFHEILVFVYYLTKFNRLENVSYGQIMSCYFEVDQKPPQIGDAIPHPDNHGLLIEGPEKDIVKLTPLGQKFVELRMSLMPPEMKEERPEIANTRVPSSTPKSSQDA